MNETVITFNTDIVSSQNKDDRDGPLIPFIGSENLLNMHDLLSDDEEMMGDDDVTFNRSHDSNRSLDSILQDTMDIQDAIEGTDEENPTPDNCETTESSDNITSDFVSFPRDLQQEQPRRLL
mmetsp:Transcript_23252/g.34327  ORF Transcript_23252/g.34327 Transcript_23252/m.34327 type:complete len:122 (-) Transcript_23252:401-766(-)|eukprot:CAMPEP_0194234852 /NCGR_PEP_ID=MMETSP0158-20130606/2481_1 /TAXON_ID=33649 /ORGANISM="Thalassionema nitzschioides, Strain L26-B" /LENGTH=121 /DNA_ID=CAMNT_0038968147 /DNA_START=24 /DNA_END=389 /DNA_ORIENTATION=+